MSAARFPVEKHVVQSSITREQIANLSQIVVAAVQIPLKIKEENADSITFIPDHENLRFFMIAKNQNAKSCSFKLVDKQGAILDFQPVVRVLTKHPQKEHIFYLTHMDLTIYMETPPIYSDKSAVLVHIIAKRADNAVQAIEELSSDDEEEAVAVVADQVYSYKSAAPLLRSQAMAASVVVSLQNHVTNANSSAATVVVAGPTTSAIPLENSSNSSLTASSNNSTVPPTANGSAISMANHAPSRVALHPSDAKAMQVLDPADPKFVLAMQHLNPSNDPVILNSVKQPATKATDSRATEKPTTTTTSSARATEKPTTTTTSSSSNDNDNDNDDMDESPYWPMVTQPTTSLKRKADVISTGIQQQPARSFTEQKELLCLAEQTANLIMDICPPILYNREFKQMVTQYIYYSNQTAAHKVRKFNV